MIIHLLTSLALIQSAHAIQDVSGKSCAERGKEAGYACQQTMKLTADLLRGGGGGGGGAGGGSVSSAAAELSSQSKKESGMWKDAADWCEARKNICKGACTNDSSTLESSINACNEIHARAINTVDCSWASPLILQLNDQPLRMTAVSEGVSFDILGRRSPVPHEPRRISWFAKESRATHGFLVLPDARGEVRGVDELFGNNTFGPDKTFADNGFEALRKYDGRRTDGTFDADLKDGVIDAKDEIFPRLRVWRDLNGDGVAQSIELSTLSEVGVTAIDLVAITGEIEVEEHGNLVMRKSIARFRDQGVRLVLDLWFKL